MTNYTNAYPSANNASDITRTAIIAQAEEDAAASAAAAAASASAAAASAATAGSTASASVAAVAAQQATSIAAVQSQQTTSVNAVSAQQTTSVNAVSAQQTTSVNAVAAQGTTSIAAVEAEGDTQVARVQATSGQGFSTYADTTAGLAATSSGGYFGTIETGEAASINVYLDNAGSAVFKNAVPSNKGARDLYRFGKLRYDTQIAEGEHNVANLQLSSSFTLGGGATIDSDGYITLPASATLTSQQWSTAAAIDPTQSWYGKVVVLGAPGTPSDITIEAYWNAGATVFAAANTTTNPFPGVYEQTWINTYNGGLNARPNFQWKITNASASTIRIRKPELYTTDSEFLPVGISYDAHLPAPSSPPQLDLEFWRKWPDADRFLRHNLERQITLAADSVNGSSGNSGTSRNSPKDTLAGLGTPAADAVIGLRRNSTFREMLPVYNGSNILGINVMEYDYGAQGNPFPKVSAFTAISNGAWTAAGDGTYNYTFTSDAAVTQGAGSNRIASNGYDYIPVIEIDTTISTTTPIAAVNQLTFVANQAAVVATAGTCFVESLGSNQWKAHIRPSDDQPPGTRYTYEVVTRYVGAWFGSGMTARDGALAGITLQGASYGYGALAAPIRFVGDRLIWAGGLTTHSAVVFGGKITRDLTWAKGGPELNAMTFYSTSPTGVSWEWSDGWSIETYSPFYAHTSGSQYSRGVVRNRIMTYGRRANGALKGEGIAYAQTDNILAEYNYVRGYQRGLNPSTSTSASIVRYNIFRECGRVDCPEEFYENIVQVENISDPSSVNNRNMRCIQQSAVGSYARRNLFYAKTTTNALADYTVNMYGQDPKGDISRNVFLLDGGNVNIVTETTNVPVDYTADYNVILHCAGSITCAISGIGTVTGWESYLSTTSQDANSLYIDLRDDPRGVQAVYVDPENGDFRYANTDVAERVQAFCAANSVGPRRVPYAWPTELSVDDIAQLLYNL